MEGALARLLAWRWMEPGESKEQLRAELVRSYRELAGYYDTAAIPHYRLSIVLYDPHDTARSSDDLAEAIASMREAYRLLAADKHLMPITHWVRSTIRRRLAALLTLSDELSRKTMSVPQTPLSSTPVLIEALKLLLEAERLIGSSCEPPGVWAEEERDRRRNNIVHDASELLAAGCSWAMLEGVGLDEAGFAVKLEEIGGMRFQDLDDVEVLDTIAHAYQVLGQEAHAKDAAKKAWELALGEWQSFGNEKREHIVRRCQSIIAT
jgi:hypothetical protein